MNTQSIDCRKVMLNQMPENGGIEKVGDFCFSGDFKTIYIWIPGMSGPDAIQIQKGPAGGNRVWGWDGNEEKPTLTPSINAVGEWHGWLKSGRLESC